MRYVVELAGRAVEVTLRGDGAELEVSIGGGPWVAARLDAWPAPLNTLTLGTRRVELRLEDDPFEPGALAVALPGRVPVRALAQDARARDAALSRGAAKARGPRVQKSPMPGVVIEVRAAVGAEVSVGQVLLVLEAMKMQNEIKAERAGRVERVHVKAGQSVPAGAPLVELAAEAAPARE